MTAPRSFYVKWAWITAAVGLTCLDIRAWMAASAAGFSAPTHPGMDFDTYRAAAERWLSGGGFYFDWQLSGPYSVWFQAHDPILYPPTMIPLFAAFTVLPAILWWAIPVGAIVASIAYHRPRPLALLVIAGLVAWPNSLAWMIWFGNPTIWMVAALALATTGRTWAGAWVLGKPSIFPAALWGVRTRGWWIGITTFVALSLAFLPLWADYITVLLNSRDAGLLYSVWNIPPLLVPVAAYIGSLRHSIEHVDAENLVSRPAEDAADGNLRHRGRVGPARVL